MEVIALLARAGNPGEDSASICDRTIPLATQTLVSAMLRTVLSQTAALLGTLLVMAACGSDSVPDIPSNPSVEAYAASLNVDIAQMTRKSDHLFIQDLKVGTGTDAIAGRSVDMRYTGWLVNGIRFDSNMEGAPFSFILGVGQVIAGWDQGVAGMKVGGKRKLVIGSALGYGRSGQGPIPANSTLVFDVELLGVR